MMRDHGPHVRNVLHRRLAPNQVERQSEHAGVPATTGLALVIFQQTEGKAHAASKATVGPPQSKGTRQEGKRIKRVIKKTTIASQNMALAETREHHAAMAQVFDDLMNQRQALEQEVSVLKATSTKQNIQVEVDTAMNLAIRLTELASASENLEALGNLFQKLNARLFLRFERVKMGKRSLNKVVTGVVTMGSAPFPCPIYQGPTARNQVKDSSSALESGPDGSSVPTSDPAKPGQEEDSLGNVNRGERI